MDCERLKSECHCGGPESWASSEKSIQGFCETLLDAGIPPTLFVVPETAQQHSQLLCTLAGRGVELGMHLHPQCWQDHRYQKYLGEYDAATQKQLLVEAREMWIAAMGRQPQAFRPGNFSASDKTLGVLVELGFTHGAVTDPGRNIPDFYADWKNALTYVHWANHRNLALQRRLVMDHPVRRSVTDRV
jgi:predicted deacetylase